MATPHFPLSFTFRLPSFRAQQFNFLSLLNQLWLIPAADLNSPSRNRITQWQLSIFFTVHFAYNLEEHAGVLMTESLSSLELSSIAISVGQLFWFTCYCLMYQQSQLFQSYLPLSLDYDNVLANASEMTATTAEGKNDCPLGLLCYHLWV